MAVQVSDYLEAHNELDKLAGVALKRIQHFYYKTGSQAVCRCLVVRSRSCYVIVFTLLIQHEGESRE